MKKIFTSAFLIVTCSTLTVFCMEYIYGEYYKIYKSKSCGTNYTNYIATNGSHLTVEGKK